MTDYLVHAWQLSDFDGPFAHWQSEADAKTNVIGSRTRIFPDARPLEFIASATSRAANNATRLTLVKDTQIGDTVMPAGSEIETECLLRTGEDRHSTLAVAKLCKPGGADRGRETRLVFTFGAATRGQVMEITAANTTDAMAQKTICFAKGTMIETPHGELPIELLVAGDEVLTSAGKTEEIVWVGKRSVTAFELSQNPDLRPVRIRKNALAPNCPTKDLIVSPSHKILVDDWRAEYHFGVDEVLVPAKALIDGKNIVTDDLQNGVDYFHILLESHELLRANGQWAETLLPVQDAISTLTEQQCAEIATLQTEFFTSLSDSYVSHTPIAPKNPATVLAA